jgi:hypothetical protein
MVMGKTIDMVVENNGDVFMVGHWCVPHDEKTYYPIFSWKEMVSRRP